MSRFAPKDFAEALANRGMLPQKPRQPISRGKGLQRSSGVSGLKSTKLGCPTAGRKKVKKAKRAKLPSRKSLVKKLDTLTSLIVRFRDGGRCVLFGINETCSGSEKLQCGHIFGRRSHGARFDIEAGGNTAAQCANCNIKHNSHQWIFYKWYIDQYGQEAFDAMYTRWSRGRKYSRLELIALVAEHQAKLAEMENQCSNDA